VIENWKDTAFGSDFGGDFLELVERITKNGEISLSLIFQYTDAKQYLDTPDLLEERTDINVNFTDSEFEQYIHFEDFIIALSAMMVESSLNGRVDLRKAYGTKVLGFEFDESHAEPVYTALKHIYTNPDSYILFEMCAEEERKETLDHISEIMLAFEKILH